MIIAANWKMNLDNEEAQALINALNFRALDWKNLDVIFCPAAPYLQSVRAKAHQNFHVGGQYCHAEAKGAFTGDMSAAMLKDCGASHVIIGHSERRQYAQEQGQTLKQQAMRAIEAGLDVIFCVGEQLSDRQNGAEETVVADQLADIAEFLKTGQVSIIAYEPVWAIGTGQVASVLDIQAMHQFIKTECQRLAGDGRAPAILYGGSVKSDNAEAILSAQAVDGALVGGASLDALGFQAICDEGQKLSTG